jgi:hypothetical protein
MVNPALLSCLTRAGWLPSPLGEGQDGGKIDLKMFEFRYKIRLIVNN